MERKRLRLFEAVLLRHLTTVSRAIEDKRQAARREASLLESDPLDFCVQSFLKEQAYLLCEKDRQKLALVREALARIQSDSYGLCEECKAPIGSGRLRAAPWSKLCIRCQYLRENAIAS